MPRLIKFNGYLVEPRHVSSVVTPAYDAMLPAERRSFAEENPDNYVNVMRTLEEFAEHEKPSLDDILHHNQSCLNKLFEKGVFNETRSPAYFIYRLRVDSHEQVGLVANVPLEDYTTGRLKKHEHTQVEKESMLTRYNEVVGVTSSPVCVAYPPSDSINAMLQEAMSHPPYLHFSVWDDVEQTVWQISDPSTEMQLEEEFAQIESTYLTDGHHRCASSAAYSELKIQQAGHSDPKASHNQLFVALFPENQLRILPYYRNIRDLNGMVVAELIRAIEALGITVLRKEGDCSSDWLPRQPREILMMTGDAGYALKIPESMIPDDPSGSLDISVLHEKLIGPVLGVHDPRTDERIKFTPGVAGINGLVESFKQGWELGFACFHTTMEELMRVADAGQVMPPKSTWFDPKLRAGIFLRKV